MKKHCFLVAFGVLILLASCVTRVKSLNQIEPYASKIGKKFVLKTDCYVVKFVKSEAYRPYPLQIFPPGYAVPSIISTNYIGTGDNFQRIFGIVKQGSVFTVVGARHEWIPMAYDEYIYEIVFGDSDYAKWKVCDSLFLCNPRYPPSFDQKYVEPVADH
jgi:hypothetical protein